MVKLNDAIEDPIAASLEHAACLIEDGWCKHEEHKLIGDKLHYCAIGALRVVAMARTPLPAMRYLPCNAFYFDLERAVVSALRPKYRLSRDCDSITTFNDYGTRRKRDVVSLLRRAARKCTVKSKEMPVLIGATNEPQLHSHSSHS